MPNVVEESDLNLLFLFFRVLRKRLRFHLFILLFALSLALFMGWFSQWGVRFQVSLIVIALGHPLVALLTEAAHRKARTASYEELAGEVSLNEFRVFLKNLVGLLEICLYVFLFVFQQLTLVAGWLVIKALWKYDRKREGTSGGEDFVTEEGAAIAIFRVGLLSSLFVAFIAALLVRHSGFEESKIYHSIQHLFPWG